MNVARGPGSDAPLLPLAALEEWMAERGVGDGSIEGVERLGGGSQNILVRFRRGARAFVLRRGPQHLRPESNRVIARESRVLAALDGTDVPHPRLIASCDDPGVLGGAVFYLMEPVDGFNPAVELPTLHAQSTELRHAMGLAAADALARLGAVDHEHVGLADFGRPDGFLERQVPRWLAHLAAYDAFDGYDPSRLPGVETIATWLDENRPATWSPGILHGDFHLGNLLFDRHGPGVVAIVDWEMCTIGDPLLDLGLLLASWPTPDGATPLSGVVGAAGGLPSTGELVGAYAERSARDLSALDWYVVLACFKTGIVVDGTYARACAGRAPKATGDFLHEIALGLLDRGLQVMRAGQPA